LENVIHTQDRSYTLTTSSRLSDRTRVLKDGDSFAIFDRHGDIHAFELGEPGVYHRGTRFLSRLDATLGSERPLLLSSVVRDDNALFAVDLTNPDVRRDGTLVLLANSLHLWRVIFLHDGTCYQRFHLRSFAAEPIEVVLGLWFAADFADIFEVRGMRRERRGQQLEPAVTPSSVALGYQGLDGVIRRTRLAFSPGPDHLSDRVAEFRRVVEPEAEATYTVSIGCELGECGPVARSFESAFAHSDAKRAASGQMPGIVTPNPQFNRWMSRSAADLRMLIGDTANGPYPYAGVPWYSTVFGRDGLITALECLWLAPALARGVLAHLAATQATEEIPERDAEPGKIVHEMRDGEMAALGEIPFGCYYGTVDATPLFVLLCGAYWRRTGERGFVEELWPHVERALQWIDRYGDRDQDGFVEYRGRSERGLANQGWKDSTDSIFHADGTLAKAPIALCEVQGYVEAAKRAAAEVAESLGEPDRAARLRSEAARLREQIDRVFWCEDLGCHALALDDGKRPCRVRTSNAGHLLFTESIPAGRAERLSRTLLDDRSFSGWGVRTVAHGEPRYNPMSYHNGSIWPHDNALIAAGLARYGFADAAARIAASLFEASDHLELHRLPELFCGFDRRPGEGPTLYPVACSPQAWSVGSPYLLLEACLGLSVRGTERAVSFRRPFLPDFLEAVTVQGLAVGTASLDLRISGRGPEVAIQVLRRTGDVAVTVEP
jgi:glycogen debranching enzyme